MLHGSDVLIIWAGDEDVRKAQGTLTRKTMVA